jgi:hypothetical protein
MLDRKAFEDRDCKLYTDPKPPGAHWAWVLATIVVAQFLLRLPKLAGLYGLPALALLLLSTGLFAAWQIVQAVWLKRVMPSSLSLWLFCALAGIQFGNIIVGYSFGDYLPRWFFFTGLVLEVVIYYVAIFRMAHELETYFRDADPVGLSLSGLMIFFFGSLYFQYHLREKTEFRHSQLEPVV